MPPRWKRSEPSMGAVKLAPTPPPWAPTSGPVPACDSTIVPTVAAIDAERSTPGGPVSDRVPSTAAAGAAAVDRSITHSASAPSAQPSLEQFGHEPTEKPG